MSLPADARVEDFFAFAKKRHQIYLDREAGKPWPWTDDQILRDFRFTNVFRELDATTVHFREKIRDPMRDDPNVLLATVVGRWFNRRETMDVLLDERLGLMTGDFQVDLLEEILIEKLGEGPYVTGAFIVKTPNGMTKLQGLVKSIRDFMTTGSIPWHVAAQKMLENPGKFSLEQIWTWLEAFPYMGPFSAYEVVSDLRWTCLLESAPDIMTWANPGPGAKRGLQRLAMGAPTKVGHEWHWKPNRSVPVYIEWMRELLAHSQDRHYWPADWRQWEMRDVEHTLCEFDKYERTRTGMGQPRGRYYPPVSTEPGQRRRRGGEPVDFATRLFGGL